MRTPDLIEPLVADAHPVRRLWPPIVRAACWLLLAMLVLALVALGHGVRPDLMLKLRQPAACADSGCVTGYRHAESAEHVFNLDHAGALRDLRARAQADDIVTL